MHGESADCGKVLDFFVQHQLVEAADRILVKVRRAAVKIQRRRVLVLLIDEDRRGIVFKKVGDLADAPRLLARGQRERPQHRCHLVMVLLIELQTNRKAQHKSPIRRYRLQPEP